LLSKKEEDAKASLPAQFSAFVNMRGDWIGRQPNLVISLSDEAIS